MISTSRSTSLFRDKVSSRNLLRDGVQIKWRLSRLSGVFGWEEGGGGWVARGLSHSSDLTVLSVS